MLIRSPSLEQSLGDLLSDPAVLALQVPSYVSDRICEHARLNAIPSVLESSLQRIYRSQVKAFSETVSGEADGSEEYLRRSRSVLRSLREAFLPFANPADVFRAEIDEIWPGGAGLLKYHDQPLVFGMMRSWEAGMSALPHFDIIGEAGPTLRGRFRFTEQFGVNLYLEAPEDGGELHVWDLTFEGVKSWNIPSISGTYGFDAESLPSPDITIKPGVGDLVIIRSTRLHAVKETTQGRRVSISGFLGREQTSDILRLWS